MKDRIELNIFQVRKYDIFHIINYIRLKGRHFFNGVSLEITGAVHLIVQGVRRWGGGKGIYIYCVSILQILLFTYFIWKQEKNDNVKHITVFIDPRHTIPSENNKVKIFLIKLCKAPVKRSFKSFNGSVKYFLQAKYYSFVYLSKLNIYTLFLFNLL